MDDTLRIIRYLYGEEEDPAEVERRLADDEALRAEYKKLHSVKRQLDGRSRRRPDAEVIDRIMEAAQSAQASTSDEPSRKPRRDREPVRPSTSTNRRRVLGMATALVLIAVAVGLWQYPSSQAPSQSLESAPLATDQSGSQALDRAEERQGDLPAWDETEDVVRLHRYIETLQSRSRPGSWDAGTFSFQTASQTRPSN